MLAEQLKLTIDLPRSRPRRAHKPAIRRGDQGSIHLQFAAEGEAREDDWVWHADIISRAHRLYAVPSSGNHPPRSNWDKGPNDTEQRSVHPSSEIDSAREHKLRLRLLTLEPGSVVELRSHKDHPTVLHVIKGILTSYSQNRPEVVLRAGVGLAEGKDSNFWVQNIGSEPAEFIWLPVYESAP